MKPNIPAERLYNGIIKENFLVLMLGMCPTLAITTFGNQWYRNGTYYNSDPCSIQLNDLSSEKLYSDRVRMLAFIVVVASFVTVVQLLLQGFIPSLCDSLGIYSLIVVNCIILQKHMHPRINRLPLFDGIGMGLIYLKYHLYRQ